MATINGTAGNDTLEGNYLPDDIHGLAGDDVLRGGDEQTFVPGSPPTTYYFAYDFLYGGDGNDVLIGDNNHLGYQQGSPSFLSQMPVGNLMDGGAGDDQMYGGGGDETYYVDSPGDQIFEPNYSYVFQHVGDIPSGTGGLDTVYSTSSYTLPVNVEVLNLDGTGNLDGVGNGSDNTINGTAGANGLAGLGGNDYLYGGAGDDRLYGGDGSDFLQGDGFAGQAGAAGNDMLDGGAGADLASYDSAMGAVSVNLALGMQDTGAGGMDTLMNIEYLLGSSFDDTLVGDGGANVLTGGGGADTIYGGAGDDWIEGDQSAFNGGVGGTGTPGADTLAGGDGNDTILGGAGDDRLFGGDGVDTIVGEAGNDLAYGDAQTDYIDGRQGNDQLFGGDGNDVIFGDGLTSTYGFGGDTIHGDAGDDTLMGESGDHTAAGAMDIIYGDAGNDLIFGGGGGDWIFGGDGNDVIDGGEGSDFIVGGAGADVMLGSGASAYSAATSGGDLFSYSNLADGGDTIYGFDTDMATANDALDLRSLFDSLGYAGNDPRADGYLYVYQNGANTDVYVDADGPAGDANLTPLASLQNLVATDLTDSYFLFQ